jgi:magnesium-transporting ATPase (P-type)
VIAQSANAFACRSVRRPAWKLGWFSNRFLIASVLIELAFAVAVVAIPAAADLLEHDWPPAGAWIVIVASAPAVLLVDAIWKRAIRRQTSAAGFGEHQSRSAGQVVDRRTRS